MPAKPETKLQQKIRKALEDYGGQDLYIFKMHGGPHSPPGVPDLILCYRGRFVGLEVKLPTRRKKVTEQQAYHLGTIRRAGGYSHVVCDEEEALFFLKRIDREVKDGAKREEAAEGT
jgi:hypothetical protein